MSAAQKYVAAIDEAITYRSRADWSQGGRDHDAVESDALKLYLAANVSLADGAINVLTRDDIGAMGPDGYDNFGNDIRGANAELARARESLSKLAAGTATEFELQHIGISESEWNRQRQEFEERKRAVCREMVAEEPGFFGYMLVGDPAAAFQSLIPGCSPMGLKCSKQSLAACAWANVPLPAKVGVAGVGLLFAWKTYRWLVR